MPQPAPLQEDVPFSVSACSLRTPVIVELLLRPVSEHLGFTPGQYVLVGDVNYDRPVRSYSIANAPRPDGAMTLLVTKIPGGELSTWLHQLRPGEKLLLTGPYGSFIDRSEAAGARLYLAGGSGLAPVRALIEDAMARPSPPLMTLLFSARTERDLIDDAGLRSWDDEHKQFRYLRTLTRATGPPPVGHVPDVLADLFPTLDGHRVFIAGNSGFVSACEATVRRHGASAGHVFTEEFFTDPDPGPPHNCF